MTEPIGEFLDDLSSEGSEADPGQFTISGEKALQKLAEFTLADPKHWVLKMVQAAVCIGATSLHFKQHHLATSVEMDSSESPSAEEVRTAIFEPHVKGSDIAQCLGMALRSLLDSCGFELSLSDGSGLRWKEGVMTPSQGSDALVGLRLEVFIRATTVHERCKDILRTEELLRQRAALATLTITIDGQEITAKEVPWESRYGTQQNKDSPLRLCLANFSHDEGKNQFHLSTDCSLPAKKWFSDALRDDRPFLTWAPSQSFQYQACLELYLTFDVEKQGARPLIRPRRDTFTFKYLVKGVVVAERRFSNSALGGHLILQQNDLATDLTGLKAEVTEAAQRQAQGLLLRLLPLVKRQLLERIDGYEGGWHRDDIPELAGTVVFAASALGLMSIVTGAPILWIGGPCLALGLRKPQLAGLPTLAATVARAFDSLTNEMKVLD